MTPDERRDATKVGLDLPSDPHENENDEAQETSQAEGNRSADKSVELASLQEELAQQVRRRATKANALRGAVLHFYLLPSNVQRMTLRFVHPWQRQRTLDAVLTLLPSLDDDGLAAVQEAITGLVR